MSDLHTDLIVSALADEYGDPCEPQHDRACLTCASWKQWEAVQAEIERLRGLVQSHEQEIEELQFMADRLRQKLYDAQRERDDAREAARWFYDRSAQEARAWALDSWPWLEEV